MDKKLSGFVILLAHLIFCFTQVLPEDSSVSAGNQKQSLVLKSKAHIVVAKDGSGNYKTLREALSVAPNNNHGRFIIYLKRGSYKEVVVIGKMKTNITIVGDGADVTFITGSLNAIDGVKTFDSATLVVEGDGFIGQDFCVQNTAGPAKGQAVALRVSADRVVLYRCRIEAYQDTLYAHKNRQFYRECQIRGTVDFICGDATAVFQKCEIQAREPLRGQGNVITAQSRNFMNETSVFSFQKCNLTASQDLTPVKAHVKTFLGRPWGMLSRVVFLQCYMGDLIAPEGYDTWNGDLRRSSTVYYAEYKNFGPGAVTSKRVGWKGFREITNPKEAETFTLGQLIQDHSWLNSTGVPYDVGL